MNSCVTLFPFGNRIIIVSFGMTFFSQRALETKAGGGTSTVKVERRNEQYLDGAQRAVQSKGDSRKPTEKKRKCAAELRFRKAM